MLRLRNVLQRNPLHASVRFRADPGPMRPQTALDARRGMTCTEKTEAHARGGQARAEPHARSGQAHAEPRRRRTREADEHVRSRDGGAREADRHVASRDRGARARRKRDVLSVK